MKMFFVNEIVSDFLISAIKLDGFERMLTFRFQFFFTARYSLFSSSTNTNTINKYILTTSVSITKNLTIR